MGDGGSDEERSLLEKKQRELERLDREADEQKNAGRQLDRLDRELEQAAEDLMKDLGASADDLDKGAEDINRMDSSSRCRRKRRSSSARSSRSCASCCASRARAARRRSCG